MGRIIYDVLIFQVYGQHVNLQALDLRGCELFFHLYRTEPAYITGPPEYFREFPEYEKILDQILVRV